MTFDPKVQDAYNTILAAKQQFVINPSIKIRLTVGYKDIYLPATPELINAIFSDQKADVEVKLVWKPPVKKDEELSNLDELISDSE